MSDCDFEYMRTGDKGITWQTYNSEDLTGIALHHGSETAHCCFKYSILDDGNNIAECFDYGAAQRIAAALAGPGGYTEVKPRQQED